MYWSYYNYYPMWKSYTFLGNRYRTDTETDVLQLHPVPTSTGDLFKFITARNEVGQGYIFTGICHSVNGGVSAPGGVPGAWRPPGLETPPGRPLLRAVRILLECILVSGFPLFRTDKIPWYFHDFSRFFSKFPGIFSVFLKYDFQVVLNINNQIYRVSFEEKINHLNYTPN